MDIRCGSRHRPALARAVTAVLLGLAALAPHRPAAADAPAAPPAPVERGGGRPPFRPPGDPLLERARSGPLPAWEPLAFLRVPEAWAAGATGRGIVVAVVDTGVDVAHEDLAGQCLPGFNALDGSADVTDNYFHGTQIAGAIAALAGNGRGYAGVAPGAKILPIKVGEWREAVPPLADPAKATPAEREAQARKVAEAYAAMADDQRRELEEQHFLGPAVAHGPLAKGIRWAADHGAKVICVGVGGGLSTAELRAAVEYAQSRGCLLVAPSGAEHEANQDLYPADYPGVLAVTAVAPRERIERVVEGGSELEVTVDYTGIAPRMNVSPRTDLAAPVKIVAPLPGGRYSEDGLTALYGTSCATALVAGVAALAWSAAPDVTAADVRRLLRASARPAIGTPGFYDFFNVRVADAFLAVTLAAPGKADVGVRRIDCAPFRPVPGRDAVAWVTVENAGRGKVDAKVRLRSWGAGDGELTVPLGPWEAARVPFPLKPRAGLPAPLRLRAECGGAPGEPDSSDNALERTFAAALKPAALGYVPRVERSELLAGDAKVTFTADVLNVGSAAGDFAVAGEVNDATLATHELRGVKPGERRTVQFRWNHPGGPESAFVFSTTIRPLGAPAGGDADDVTLMAFHFNPGSAKAGRQ